MPIVKEREYRAMLPLKVGQTQKRIESDYYVEGYATTFNDPYVLYTIDGIDYREEIDRNVLDGADVGDIIFQYNHQGKVLARTSNGTLGIEADERGLFVYADLGTTAASRELYEEIKTGLVTRMSWAWIPGDEEYIRDTRTRRIKRMKKVYDVSAVSHPANPDTEIMARSFFDGEIEKERRESLNRRARLLKNIIDLEVNK